ncbi:prolyl oligopeptidase family serine peptidase [Nocardia sp. NPDC052566]|uniref:prolyl oligopeptidase family serine peptidase n=1 Tax=Nocardia sp. NPDC052566 TaxID=3364330 RepID=UPI0037CB2843
MYLARMLHRPIRRTATTIAALLFTFAVVAGTAHAAPDEQDPAREDVSFTSHGVTLHGTVFTPRSGAGPAPAVVLVHGSGPGPRAEYVPEAEAFARAGIVTLAFDKRTDGYSDFERDYSLLADDAIAGVRLLRSRPDVDPAHVGLWGLSEGGWVAPLAASKTPDIGFVVTIGGSGHNPLRTQTWNLGNKLRHQGIRGSELDAITMPAAHSLAGTGLFAEHDHDPVPVLERLQVPILGLWGEHDTLVPGPESARIFQEAGARAGNRSVTTRFVPGAGHNGHLSADGFTYQGGSSRDGEPRGALGPGYADVITAWIGEVAAGRPPLSSAEPAPPQAFASREAADDAWYEALSLQYTVLVALLLIFAGYPAAAIARATRFPADGTSRTRSVRRLARWLSATGFLAVFGTVTYLLWTMAAGAKVAVPILADRSIYWLAVQLIALAAVALTVVTAAAWWRVRDELVGAVRIRLTLLLLGAAVFVPWALYWRVLLP